MPGTTVGAYTGELTAGTEVSSTYEGRHLTLLETELIHPFRASGLVNKGDPVIICNAAVVAERGNAVGVALATATAITDYIAIDTEGIWNLPFFAYDDTGGGSAIVAGDPLYIHDGSTGGVGALGTGDATISKRRNNITQMPFGYALGAAVATATGQMAIKVHWDPIAHWLLDDELLLFGFGAANDADMTLGFNGTDLVMLPVVSDGPEFAIGDGTSLLDMSWYGTAAGNFLRFDASANELYNEGVAVRIPEDEVLEFGAPDHTFSWTGQEIEISGDRVTGGDGDYYRVLHVSSGVTLGAVDRWGTISCYTTMGGAVATATSAFAGSFSLVQETVQVTGFFGAVMAEIKNEADNCATACALFCRWDNDSNVGFGGVMHSFIRFEDNSGGLPVQCLFELYGMDASNAASATAIVCQMGNATTCSHVIKISIGGVPYWVMMDSTPPA